MKKFQTVKEIVIVGGGSAAWLTAAYLSNQIPKFNYTVIDKEVGTPVGVGEATLLKFRRFMELCGFVLSDWYEKVEATEKLGIEFTNWIRDGKTVYHPFDVSNEKYKDNMTIRSANGENVGYHINCALLTTYIQKKIKDKVKFIDSEVVKFDGNSVLLKNNQIIEGDLFIDCTGFKSVLKEHRERVDLSDRLVCDTAVAAHVPYADEQREKLPYVTCEAVDEGWVWTIPIQSRMGTGFLFNRKITDIENAKKFLSDYWSNRIKPENLKVIDWTPYYDKNMWDDNVVSIGLSAGFIEPLESTSLALSMESVFRLSKRIIRNYFDENDIDIYNKQMEIFFNNCINFVSMHYIISQRDGEFWDEGRKLKKSEQMNYYENNLTEDLKDRSMSTVNDSDFFIGRNWKCWLTQQ